jgi:hypothetical protein
MLLQCSKGDMSKQLLLSFEMGGSCGHSCWNEAASVLQMCTRLVVLRCQF